MFFAKGCGAAGGYIAGPATILGWTGFKLPRAPDCALDSRSRVATGAVRQTVSG
jgi:hypothetical protein